MRIYGRSTVFASSTTRSTTNPPSPRVCFNFSEPLARKNRFRALYRGRRRLQFGDLERGAADLRRGPQARRALRDRACARACLRRSARTLLKSADYEIYVRDRSPQAHFAGQGVCAAAPGTDSARRSSTVNTAKVSNRGLSRRRPQSARDSQRDDFLKPIDSSRAEEIESQDGAKVWSGAMDVASALNQDVVTDFPLSLTPSASLKPGVYVVTATAVEGRGEPARCERERQRRQLAPRNGWWSPTWASLRSPARTACTLWCNRWAPPGRSRASNCKPDRAQQRSAGDEEDRRRRAGRFRSRSIARQPAARRPGLLVAARSPDDYGFLSLAQNARSISATAASPAATPPAASSTRSSTPSAASIARARPCSRRRFCATPRAWRNPACR